MEDGELIKALKYALEFEIKGENIYEDLANKAEDDFVKNTFSGLAKDELIHIQVITKYMESIEGETEFDFEKELKKVTTSPKRLFGVVTEDFRKKAKLDAEQLKPFDTGIELENKSINYYIEQSKKAKSDMTKKFFEFLIKQEKFHLKSLQEAKDFLGDPENFYVEFERWSLEG
jgi:rubrerythrin